jgi:LIVCS family branched-chain amino acid:cation transporter
MDKQSKLSWKQLLGLGTLLFGLFFGAGNVIFPVKMGQDAGARFFPASIGFILTAVGLPILGIISSALSKEKSIVGFVMPCGKKFAYFYSILLYLTIGPFFAIPRTATVAFEVGIRTYTGAHSGIYLFIYSLVFFILVWIFSMKANRIMDVVGRFMTPLFIILCGILVIAVFISPASRPSENIPITPYDTQALSQGMLDGYNTMDALASLVFAGVIMTSLNRMGVTEDREVAVSTLKASLFTILFFVLLYGSFVYLGASSRPLTPEGQNGGVIMAYVSRHYFGFAGQILLALIIGVACLKTAIGLIVSLSQAFHELFPAVSYKSFQIAFILVAFLIANFGLDQIIQWSVPVLMFLYPLAIVLIFLRFLKTAFPAKITNLHFQLTCLMAGMVGIFDFLKALPDFARTWSPIAKLIQWADGTIPFYKSGLGFFIPAVLGFTLAAIITGLRKARSKRRPN